MATVLVLQRMADFDTTLRIGAALNAACAVTTLAMARHFDRLSLEPVGGAGSTALPLRRDLGNWQLSAWAGVYALSGFIALSLEIVWFCVLGVVLKANAFTFGQLLAVYLGGVALGTMVGRRLRLSPGGSRDVYLLLQAAIPATAALTLLGFLAAVNRIAWADSVWRYMADYSTFTWANLGSPLWFAVNGVVPVLLMLPATVLMGLGFGLLQRAVRYLHGHTGAED